MSLAEKDFHESNLVFAYCAKEHGAKHSAWHPERPIENLADELRSKGPLLVKGKFGQFYYEDSCFKLDSKIQNRSIFGWNPKAKRKEGVSILHAVLIVGADEKKGRVFFIDPLDGTDPKDIQSQKIYAMSLQRLKDAITNLDGKSRKWQEIPVFDKDVIENNNYALYLDKTVKKISINEKSEHVNAAVG